VVTQVQRHTIQIDQMVTSTGFSTTHIPGVHKEGPDMLSRDPAPGPPLYEDMLEDRLEGVPVTSPTSMTDTPPDNLFATTGMDGIETDIPFSNDTFATWQSEDPELRTILSGITSDHLKTDPENVAEQNNNKYFISDGLLRKNVEHYTPVVIPRSKIQCVLWRGHDHNLANHPGWKETYRTIRQMFFWKGLKNDVRLYVKSCHVCACTKQLNTRPENPMNSWKPHQPWEVISIDLIGPYPCTSRGKSYILVATDCFSRWAEVYTLGTASTKNIVEILEHEFFSRFGYPRVCLSDNGPQFVSR
jgi:Integrase zinc binding domain/Integrase core domain